MRDEAKQELERTEIDTDTGLTNNDNIVYLDCDGLDEDNTMALLDVKQDGDYQSVYYPFEDGVVTGVVGYNAHTEFYTFLKKTKELFSITKVNSELQSSYAGRTCFPIDQGKTVYCESPKATFVYTQMSWTQANASLLLLPVLEHLAVKGYHLVKSWFTRQESFQFPDTKVYIKPAEDLYQKCIELYGNIDPDDLGQDFYRHSLEDLINEIQEKLDKEAVTQADFTNYQNDLFTLMLEFAHKSDFTSADLIITLDILINCAATHLNTQNNLPAEKWILFEIEQLKSTLEIKRHSKNWPTVKELRGYNQQIESLDTKLRELRVVQLPQASWSLAQRPVSEPVKGELASRALLSTSAATAGC